MHIKNKRGQSTVEYVLLMTAVVAVIIAFVAGNKGAFQSQLNTTLNTATQEINTETQALDASHPLSNSETNSAAPYTVSVLPTSSNSTGH